MEKGLLAPPGVLTSFYDFHHICFIVLFSPGFATYHALACCRLDYLHTAGTRKIYSDRREEPSQSRCHEILYTAVLIIVAAG